MAVEPSAFLLFTSETVPSRCGVDAARLVTHADQRTSGLRLVRHCRSHAFANEQADDEFLLFGRAGGRAVLEKQMSPEKGEVVSGDVLRRSPL